MNDFYVKVYRWGDNTDNKGNQIGAWFRNGFYISRVYGVKDINEDGNNFEAGTYFLVYDDGSNAVPQSDEYAERCQGFNWIRVTDSNGLTVTMFDPENPNGKATVEPLEVFEVSS